MTSDKIIVPVWLLPKRGELDKLVQRGVKIPATITKQFQSYAAAGKGSAIGGGASIARGFAEGAGGKTLSMFERQTLKEEKEKKKRSLKVIGILAGISFALSKVPSILGGVIKMLSFGFLLILKPLADLLAMVLLPIAGIVLKIAQWMNSIAGGSLGGMISMAVVGLLTAIAVGIGGLIIGGLAKGLILSAISSLVVQTFVATAVLGLAAGLISGLLAGYISKAFGLSDTTATSIAIATGIAAAIGILFLGMTLPEVAVLAVGTAVVAGVLKALDSLVFKTTGINIGAWLQEKIWGVITRSNIEKSRPAEAGMQWYTPEETQAKFPKQTSPSSTINININGSISSLKEVGDMVKNGVTQALNTSNVRNR